MTGVKGLDPPAKAVSHSEDFPGLTTRRFLRAGPRVACLPWESAGSSHHARSYAPLSSDPVTPASPEDTGGSGSSKALPGVGGQMGVRTKLSAHSPLTRLRLRWCPEGIARLSSTRVAVGRDHEGPKPTGKPTHLTTGCVCDVSPRERRAGRDS